MLTMLEILMEGVRVKVRYRVTSGALLLTNA